VSGINSLPAGGDPLNVKL